MNFPHLVTFIQPTPIFFKKTTTTPQKFFLPLLYIACLSTVVITVPTSHIVDPVCLVVVWILWETDSESEIRVQDIY